ncbi:FAD synthase [Habropoda laboriosa]|uniref:FAD synthase n=1 Tax=Habropoda laboriosa TaxID=597456 RepID=A0A0L7QVC8_9HYME|nr:PREDICTED: FAD synthase-like [Habropoda laboriosa]KOC62597.1 FAD synthase [Habropoda laboriosa]
MINLRECMMRVLLKNRWQTRVNGILFRSKSSGGRPTVGIIVIGDEILKAQVRDTNSTYACKLLREHGIKVEKISIVPDNLEVIANEMRDFSKRFNYIFTSGGIGPTHDDITYEAAALAFNDTLYYHPTLVDIIQNCFNCGSFPSPAYKMAHIPTKCVLKFGINETTGQALVYPCVVIANVYIFPGSPMFFENLFLAVCKECFVGYKRFATREIYINAREESFADILSAVAQECPNVSFGSYPERNRYYKARVTIESENEKDTATAKRMFCERIPKNVLVDYDCRPYVDCLRKYETLIKTSERRSVYESCFKKFVNYYEKPEEVWIYLDGSEESVVMIHFARIANDKLWQGIKGRKLHAICLNSDTLKSAVNKFVHEVCDRYDVELERLKYEKTDLASSLKNVMVWKPELRILLVGERLKGNERKIYDNVRLLNDNSSMAMEVHFPLTDWTDEDVRSFFNSFSLPYYTIES